MGIVDGSKILNRVPAAHTRTKWAELCGIYSFDGTGQAYAWWKIVFAEVIREELARDTVDYDLICTRWVDHYASWLMERKQFDLNPIWVLDGPPLAAKFPET